MMAEPTSTTGIIASLLASNEGTAKASLFIGGLLGGLIRLSFQKKVSIRAAWMPLIGIATLADLLAYGLADMVGQPQFSVGSAVIMGIFGVEAVAACLRGLANLDLAGSFKQIIDSIGVRISGGK